MCLFCGTWNERRLWEVPEGDFSFSSSKDWIWMPLLFPTHNQTQACLPHPVTLHAKCWSGQKWRYLLNLNRNHFSGQIKASQWSSGILQLFGEGAALQMGWGRAGQLLAELLCSSSLCVEERQPELDKVLVTWCRRGRSLLLWQLLLWPVGLLPCLIGRRPCGKGPDLAYLWKPSQEHPLSSFWFESFQSQWDPGTNLERCWRLLSWWKGFLVTAHEFTFCSDSSPSLLVTTPWHRAQWERYPGSC